MEPLTVPNKTFGFSVDEREWNGVAGSWTT